MDQYKHVVQPPADPAWHAANHAWFAAKGFPNCEGAVDGSHVHLRNKPSARFVPDPEAYRNRKGWFSINVQATAAYDYSFTDFFIGMPGCMHDARVMATSDFSYFAERREVLNGPPVDIAGIPVLPYILADPAYSLTPWCIPPFKAPTSQNARRFNTLLFRSPSGCSAPAAAAAPAPAPAAAPGPT